MRAPSAFEIIHLERGADTEKERGGERCEDVLVSLREQAEWN